MNEGEDPPDPPKKGYFYGNRSRKRALSRYRGKGNKKSASTRPPTDSQGTNEDMPPILPEHEDLANRVQSKSAQGVITKKQLISALTSAQAQILSHQSTIDANEKKIAQLITKNESLLDSTKRARSSCRESKEVAARAEATSKSLAKELSVKCRSFESDLARAQTEMVLKESIWRQELDSCVSAEVASAMDKAEVRLILCLLSRTLSAVSSVATVRKSSATSAFDESFRARPLSNGLICPLNPAASLLTFVFVFPTAGSKDEACEYIIILCIVF